jgi:hypothetical protein
MVKSIFADQTFAADAQISVVNIKTLARLNYSVTVSYANERYTVTLVHRGNKLRKRFGASLLENALDSAMHFARDYDKQVRGES